MKRLNHPRWRTFVTLRIIHTLRKRWLLCFVCCWYYCMLWLWIALIFAIFLVKVVNMEADILKALRFELGGPTVKTFLRCVFLCWLYDLVALVYFVLVVLSWLFGSLFTLCRGCRRFCRVGQEGIDVS